MASHASALEANPETGELFDSRDIAATVTALFRRAHPQVVGIFSLGSFRTKSGRIAVVDPIAHLHKQPLVRRAPKGEHSVSLCTTRGGEVGAVIVAFAQGEVASVERATWVWPFADASRFAVDSGLVALCDYEEVGELDPIRRERLSALTALTPDVPGALVALPGIRKWNVLVCRPAPEGNHFYSAHWALDTAGEPIALIVDFAVFT